MTEQEFMQEALEWREHIAKLAADCSDQELFRERLATFDWLIKQAERVQELESNSYNAHLERLLDRREQQIKRYREALESIACFDDKEEGETTTRIDAKYIARKALEGEE